MYDLYKSGLTDTFISKKIIHSVNVHLHSVKVGSS